MKTVELNKDNKIIGIFEDYGDEGKIVLIKQKDKTSPRDFLVTARVDSLGNIIHIIDRRWLGNAIGNFYMCKSFSIKKEAV